MTSHWLPSGPASHFDTHQHLPTAPSTAAVLVGPLVRREFKTQEGLQPTTLDPQGSSPPGPVSKRPLCSPVTPTPSCPLLLCLPGMPLSPQTMVLPAQCSEALDSAAADMPEWMGAGESQGLHAHSPPFPANRSRLSLVLHFECQGEKSRAYCMLQNVLISSSSYPLP